MGSFDEAARSDNDVVGDEVRRADITRLLSKIGASSEDVAIVSLIARSTDAGYVLSHGSVILGGSTPAAMPWPEWHERECGHGESSTLKLLALAGSPSDEWTQFDHALDGWRMLRFLVPGVELPDWLTRAVSPDGSIRVGTGDVIQVNATAAEAVIRVLTGTNTSTGRLAAMVARPLVGWMHR